MGAADVLAANGIKRPAITIRAARTCGLDLAAACVVLMKESGGGRMVWGSDRVDNGGIYTPGGPVTRENYLAYRAAVKAGKIGRQGVGDCQLTSQEYQTRGDLFGGCWDPYANQLAGFTGLARLIKLYGVRDGFRRYNGSGPAAERYADDAMTKLAMWRRNLAAVPAPQEDDMPITDAEIRQIADAVWRRPTANAWGDVVGAEQILVGAEGRVAAAQNQVAALATPGAVDLDELADRVVDRLAARLGGV